MGIKVYTKKEENHSVQSDVIKEHLQQDESQQNHSVQNNDGLHYYESPKLIRRNGIYYIGYLDDMIQIEEWEAQAVYENPQLVYDLIVSYRRKYYFNTAEDSPESLFHY